MAVDNTLFSFAQQDSASGSNATGASPFSGVIADGQGNLYGTTLVGGIGNAGAVYELVKGANGYSQQTLFSFNGVDFDNGTSATGAFPVAGLLADGQGNLYGTTENYGAYADGGGTVYELVKGTGGYTQQVLFSFQASNSGAANATGAGPQSGVITDASGNLYGTTFGGGANSTGTVYELVKGAGGYSEQILLTFAGQNNGTANATGANPYAGLLADGEGDLYGTAESGGANGTGTVFELVKGAGGYSEQTLLSFDATDGNSANATGATPYGTLIADAKGNLYGTTQSGGANGSGAVFELIKGANGYAEQLLYSFDALAPNTGNASGAIPEAGVIADAKGNLFGTTVLGGTNNTGTVYELIKGPDGGYTEQTLFSFDAQPKSDSPNATGSVPRGILLADNQGNLYSTASEGGDNGTGTVFQLTDTGYTAVCYVTGTLIRTKRGEVAVERLRVGDVVATAAGAHRPIRWIGHRAYAPRFANRNPTLLPICVKAGALADGVPARDLWVSPKHALFLDGVLIPAECLVNGVTIVKAGRIDETLTYWHVELDSHDVIIAENAPAESYLDDFNRGIFHNAGSFRALYPDAVPVEPTYCAPRVENGHALAAVRRRLDARAGLAVAPAAAFGTLHGRLDCCGNGVLAGWARDDLYPDAPVCLDVLVDGVLVELLYADRYRPDLEKAGIGHGRHAFHLKLPLPPGATVEVRRSADGVGLTGSPRNVVTVAGRAAA